MTDGEPLQLFLEKRRDRSRSRGKKRMARFFSVCVERHGHGLPLSGALAGAVPASDLMVIKSSEIAASLDKGLLFLAKSIEEASKMRKAITGAIIIPSFCMVLIVAIIFLFSKMMVPILSDVIPVEKWHPMGKVLYSIASFVTSYWPVVIASIGGIIYGFIWSLPNWASNTRFKVDFYLPYSIYRDYHGAIFLVTLAALLRAGTSIGQALDLLRDAGTPWMRRHIAIMRSKIDQGIDPVLAMNTGIVHEDIAYRVIDYGERSGFQVGIEKIGFRSIELVTGRITNSAALINILSLLLVGFCLGFIILAFMLTTQGVDQAMTKI